MLSSTLAGLSLVWVDAQVREGWPFIPQASHWRWSLLLFTAVGAGFGVVGYLALWAEARWSGSRAPGLRAGFFAALGGVVFANVAVWGFSGESISTTLWHQLGPGLALLAGAGAAWCAASVTLVVVRRIQRRDYAVGLVAALVWAGVGLQLARLDLTQFVALYARLHTALEACAWLSLALGFGLLLATLQMRWPSCDRAIRVAATAALGVSVAVLVSAEVRTRIEGALRHAFLEEVYVGRMLRRLQLAEAFAADPRGFRSLSWSRLEALRHRSGLDQLHEDARWSLATPPLSREEQAELWRLRDPLRRYNIIVYYVDTLRADVANDRETMPNVAEFAAGAVRFRRAYSAGSDTLRALPALTGGDYDILSTPSNDVLRLARRTGYESTLLIPQSAQYFLAKLRPEFRFDRTLSLADHERAREVWGYGADQPTAARIVDRTLTFLDEPRQRRRPFLLWLFNFDLHNWRELSNAHVDSAMQRFNVSDDPKKLPYRYRAVAASLDAEFGRLMGALEQRKLLENTLVLFVSDHGEALGREGFWVHSVFLWEPLVRVPLMLKAPGLPAREIDERVSTVDVAPTLAHYMTSHPDLSEYAGEDLLTRLLDEPRPRRLPILLVSASKDVRVRVGVIEPDSDHKLVLSLEAALPELYDLNAHDPDAVNVAEAHPQLTRRLLRDLVASPVFPQSLWDFDVRSTKADRAAVGIPVDP